MQIKQLLHLVIILMFFNSLYAKENRFKKTKSLIVDNITELTWDNQNIRPQSSDLFYAKKFCKNLKLNNLSWRLPTLYELQIAYDLLRDDFKTIPVYTYQSKGKIVRQSYYWSDTYYKKKYAGKFFKVIDFITGKKYDFGASFYMVYTRCVSGDKLKSKKDLEMKFKQQEYDKIVAEDFNGIDTIEGYETLLEKYKGLKHLDRAKVKLFNLYDKFYHEIYKKVLSFNNIATYEWFLKNYPNAQQGQDAIAKIHALAFEKAKSINTVSAYNTFIIAYPTAKEVRKANLLAYQLEKENYTDIGWLGFFNTDEKREKQSRKLLVKIKNLVLESKSIPKDENIGYMIVVNRMYDLLQYEFYNTYTMIEEFNSQGYKVFYKAYDQAMAKRISKFDTLSIYLDYFLKVSNHTFLNSSADSKMSAYYTKQHSEWIEKRNLIEKQIESKS